MVIEKGLYIVATPIGNLNDITIRAIKILNSSDTIVCEDTRVSKKLFSHLGLEKKKNWLIYNDHSSDKDIINILNELEKDKIISLISELNFLQIESAAVSEICWETIICMRVARVGSRYRSLGSPIFKINSLK